MGIWLVGKRQTKRTDYFLKAAEQLHIPVSFADWNEVDQVDLAGEVVKLDPPSYQTTDLFEMNDRIREYMDALRGLENRGCRFLNPPGGICRVLDKRACKEELARHGVPVTEMFSEQIGNAAELSDAMERHRCYAVFVKPVFCSGAAGVMAYRMNPGREREAAYASCRLEGGELINTKTLYRTEDSGEIRRLLDAVLSLGAVVERWYPKSAFRGKSYDLRVVWQFEKAAFMVVRQSRGPVTNLHLNNAALEVERLSLPENTLSEIKGVCSAAMSVFPELAVAGIDILLEKGSMRPRIIEINGQGDLMYQDIFCENRIYQEQVRYMAAGKALPE
jgi:hypothetical protein